jgi:hypothetical protein
VVANIIAVVAQEVGIPPTRLRLSKHSGTLYEVFVSNCNFEQSVRIYKVIFTNYLFISADVKLIQFFMQYKPTNAHDILYVGACWLHYIRLNIP